MTPTADEIRKHVLEALVQIAPDVDVTSLAPTQDMREAFDLDSMDVLRLAAALKARLGVEIPEADYRQIATLDGCVAYLSAHA